MSNRAGQGSTRASIDPLKRNGTGHDRIAFRHASAEPQIVFRSCHEGFQIGYTGAQPRSALRLEKGGVGYMPFARNHSPAKNTGRVVPTRGVRSKP